MLWDLLPDMGPWLVCALAVLMGTLIQRLSGAGYGMFVAPIMALVAPQWLPGTVLLVGLVISIGAVLHSRDAVRWRDLPAGFTGRIIGAAIAAVIAAAVVGTDALGVVVGCVVIAAVLLTVAGLSVPINRVSLLLSGCLGGVMGTLTGVGGPPMAILYVNTETRSSAATQNAFYGFGTVVGILALIAAGLLSWPQLAFAATLVPIVPLALRLSRPLAARFERRAIRPWALGLATVSALVLLIHSL